MSADLLQKIGRRGDRLYRGRLPRRRPGGGDWPLTEAPPWSEWSFFWWSCDRVDAGAPWPLVIVGLVLIPLDLAHGLVRLVLWPLVVALWRLERRLFGRQVVCPCCQQRFTEFWVHCPHEDCPARVQPRLRPYFSSLFTVRCRGCGRCRWWTLGQWLGAPPAPVVCRHTERLAGCFRPGRIEALAGGHQVVHVAVAGTDVETKHQVLGRLALCQQGRPAWPGCVSEVRWYRRLVAGRTPAPQTERVGKRYVLGWALAFTGQPAVGFHNLAQDWLTEPDGLGQNGCNWRTMHHLLLILSPDTWAEGAGDPANWSDASLPAEETLGRLLRDAQECCSLPGGSFLPFPVTVCLALPTSQVGRWTDEVAADGTLPAAAVRRVLLRHCPALVALAERITEPGRLTLTGGLLAQGLPTEPWVVELSGRRQCPG